MIASLACSYSVLFFNLSYVSASSIINVPLVSWTVLKITDGVRSTPENALKSRYSWISQAFDFEDPLYCLSQFQINNSDTAMSLKAIEYNLMVVSNMKSGEKAREIKKIVVC